MSNRLKPIIATFALAMVALACSPAVVPLAVPAVAPTASPTVAPTLAPTVVPTEAPSGEAVLAFDEMGVENLANTFIDNGWFSDREDDVLDSGNKVILLEGVKSDVTVGIVHDGNDNLLRVTVYDPGLFGSPESEFDLGVINGVLLNDTLGTEAVLWETGLTAEVGSAGINETKVFGPDEVTVDAGTDAENPRDAFVFFQDAE